MKQKNILFTLDYELFLGKRSGSVARCVIEPTQKLLEVFLQNKVKAIFFVDTTWLIRLREITAEYIPVKKDYEKVVEQIRQIHKAGHYVFPHLHPHWADASYLSEINQWQLINYSQYRFHNLGRKEQEVCFRDSVNILKEILGEDYKPIAYRAGGWSIQPFEDFEPLFKQYGVKYDFSVLPGSKHISNGQHYDFSDVTATQPYLFSTDVTIPGRGEFMEFPISKVDVPESKSILNKLLLKYLQWNGKGSFGDGQGVVATTTEYSGAGGEMVAIELLTSVKLSVYLKFLERNNYMQFIAHPKMLSDHNIKVLSKFLYKTKSAYTVETDLLKVAEMLQKNDL